MAISNIAPSMLLRALLFLATGLFRIANAQSYTYNLDRRLNCTTLGCDVDNDTVQVFGKVSVDSLGNLSESSFTKWSLTWSSPNYADTTLTPTNSEVKIMGNAIVSATPCQLEIRLPLPSNTTTEPVDNDSLFGIRDVQPDPYMVEYVLFGVLTDTGLFESTEVIGHSPRNSLEGNARDEGRQTVEGEYVVALVADEGTFCDNDKDDTTQDLCDGRGSCVTGACDDGNNCTESLVIPETGECVHDPVAAGTDCTMDGGEIVGSCNDVGKCMPLASSTTTNTFRTTSRGTDIPPTEENEKDSVSTTTTNPCTGRVGKPCHNGYSSEGGCCNEFQICEDSPCDPMTTTEIPVLPTLLPEKTTSTTVNAVLPTLPNDKETTTAGDNVVLPYLPQQEATTSTSSTEASFTSRQQPKKKPVCNPSVCQACFYYCGLPPYTCDASSKSSSCRVDPWCLFCEKVCPANAVSNEDCPGGCLSDPSDFVCNINPTRRRLFSTNS